MAKHNVKTWLTQCPAEDVNHRSAREVASVRTLRAALKELRGHPEGNATRMMAICRELRKRGVRG